MGNQTQAWLFTGLVSWPVIEVAGISDAYGKAIRMIQDVSSPSRMKRKLTEAWHPSCDRQP